MCPTIGFFFYAHHSVSLLLEQAQGNTQGWIWRKGACGKLASSSAWTGVKFEILNTCRCFHDEQTASAGAVSPTFTWEKREDTKLPHNEWTAHIHFRGTSFSHYIAINSTGCGLYLVCSWSRPRDMRLLTHDSSLIFVLAPHYIRPKTNLFLRENENSSFSKSWHQTAGAAGLCCR